MDVAIRVRLLALISLQLLCACSGGGSTEQKPSAAATAPVSNSNQAGAEPPASPYPSDSQLYRSPPSTMSRPAYLSQVREPNFGTRVVRIADQTAFASSQEFLRHAYAKNQPWNADGTLILLGFTYPAPLIDAKSFQLLRWVHQPSWAVWSNVDPNILFGTIGGTNELVRQDVRSDGPFEVLQKFEQYTSISFGAGEGNISSDDRYIALFGLANGQTDLLVYDLLNKSTVATLKMGAARVCDCKDSGSINNATMSGSGNYVLVQYNQQGYGRHNGVEVFDRALQFLRQLTPGSEHGDVGVTSDGADVWVSWHDTTGTDAHQDAAAYAWRMDSGAVTAVIPKGTTLGHISCRNLRRPGYCYASHSNDPSATLADDQLYAFPLDGSMRMEVFATQHASGSTYERQPMGVPNRDGTAVLWASDWDDSAAPVYSYVAMK